MEIERICVGGWFQRTTLHLTEIYDFLTSGKSDLDFSQQELEQKKNSLGLGPILRQNWLLEYICGKTNLGIGIRIYEDGLILLEKEGVDGFVTTSQLLENYYDQTLSPVISYLFSKGAPVPKELAQIKTLLPFIVVAKKAKEEEVRRFFEDLGQPTYSDLETPHVRVYKSPKVILIVSTLSEEKTRQMVEEQIFFREFKSQLHRYLNIHRFIWEEIAEIKERGQVRGNKVREFRSKLDDYQKTVKLIESRINQMASYLHTRAKIAADQGIDKFLDQTFSFKFETLEDTLAYIKELWKMTDNYLRSAIEMLSEIQAESAKTSISSLQLITTLGVVASIITYLGRDKIPNLTWEGVVFFIALVCLTGTLNFFVSRHFASQSYILKKDKVGKLFAMKAASERN